MIRDEFPQIDDKFVYFDSAATSLKPQCMIDAISNFYSKAYATVHRSVYGLSQKATSSYENARKAIASFLGAKSDQIVFTKNTTEGINLIAYSLLHELKEGDQILLTPIEHHANLVIWQLIAKRTKAQLRFVEVDIQGRIDLEDLKSKITNQTKIAAFSYVSNVFGTIQPIIEIAKICKQRNCKVLVDGAQAVSFLPVNVEQLGVDYFIFSAHKLYGPTGLGILWAQAEHLEKMPPFLAGGDMVEQVQLDETTFAKPPLKFEAGTPPIAEVIAFQAVIEWMEKKGMGLFYDHAQTMRKKAIEKLKCIEDLHLVNSDEVGAPILSFYIDGVHPLDLATMLDQKGFALRSGHLCAQTAIAHIQKQYLNRISFGVYNTLEEIERFSEELQNILEKMKLLP